MSAPQQHRGKTMDRACVMKEPRIFEIQYKKRSVLTRGDLYGCFSGSYADKLGSIFSEYTFWARDSLYLSIFYKTLKVVLTYETIDVFLWPSFCFCLILTSTDYKPCYFRSYQVVTNVPKETAQSSTLQSWIRRLRLFISSRKVPKQPGFDGN